MPTLMEPPPAEEQSEELFHALRDSGMDAETAHRVDKEVRSQAGQNVIAAIHASAAETRAENKALFAEMNARFREMNAVNDARFREMRAENDARFREMKADNDARFREIKADNDARFREIKAEIAEVKAEVSGVKAEVRAVHSRIDTQQRVVWPLLALLATTIFSMLYGFLTGN